MKINKLRILLVLIISLTSISSYASIEYHSFKNWNQASEYFSAEIESLAAKLQSREKYPVIPKTNVAYKRVNKIISKVFKQFKRTYPDFSFPAVAPYVIIAKTNEAQGNAGVFFDPKYKKKAYLFYLHSPLLNKDDKTLTSVIAHELVHLLMQWRENGEVIPNPKYYTKPKVDFLIGDNIISDHGLEKNIPKIMTLRQYTGRYINEELGSIPFSLDSYEPGTYKELNHLFSKLNFSTQDPACLTATDQKWDLHYTIMFGANKLDSTLIFDSNKEALKTKQLALKLEKNMKKCFKGIKYNRVDFLSDVYGLQTELLKNVISGLSPLEREYYHYVEKTYATKDTVDAIFNIQKVFGEEKRQLEKDINFSKARIHTHEDHADEIALRVLKEMNIGPKYLNNFVLGLARMNCNYENLSQENIDKLDFGKLSNPHHNSCWRSFRNQYFYNKL